MAMTQMHDVLIVGGGLVGASLAIALDRSGVDVGLVEATPKGLLPAVFDQRNLSLAEATVNALRALGVLDHLRAPTGPIRRIHVSSAGDLGRVRLNAADYEREEFGRIVVARDFGEALEARLGQARRVARYRPARFVGSELDGEARNVRVVDDDGARVLRTRLLVAADGSHSQVRASLGIATQVHDYRQTLLVSRMRAEYAPDGTAYERFTREGPTALLPRGDRHFGVVHGVAREDADSVMALDDGAWLRRIQQTFGWRVGRFLEAGERSAYPLVRILAERLVAPRVVLVGNAAQSMHPNGAQGFNLGLRDALTLAESILEQGADPGAEKLLRGYVARRSEDRERTLAFSHQLALATANPSGLMHPLRSLGLLGLAASPALQAGLVGGAMGYRGHVPALCRARSA